MKLNKTIEGRVLEILRECPESRYNDMILVFHYYKRYGLISVEKRLFEDIVRNYKVYGLPCFETIHRTRQRVQSLFPELSRNHSDCNDDNIRIVIETK